MFLIHVPRSGFQDNLLHDFSRCQKKASYPLTLPFFKYQRSIFFCLLLRTLANLHAMPNGRLLVSPAGSRHHHMHQICQVFAICKLFAASVSLSSPDIKPWETLLGKTNAEGVRYLDLVHACDY